MSEHKVRCDICKEDFRATTSHINLICKECQDKEKKELIDEILKIFDRFWVKIKSHQFYDPFPLEKVREEYKKIKEEIKRLKY